MTMHHAAAEGMTVPAGMIVQAVTGNSSSTEVTNRTTTPLHLTDTSSPASDTHRYGTSSAGGPTPRLRPRRGE